MKNIIFSIIMPTYNSGGTLEKVLSSIRKQTFSQSRVEILLIDGGSTDDTLKIARKFDAIILNNEKKFPEYAKKIGIQHAKGKYIIYQDSDEIFTSNKQLENRYKLLEENPEVCCVLANKLLTIKGCGLCCSYLNTLGDPFGYFVYQNKGSIIKNNIKYLVKKTQVGNIYKYGTNDVIPIGDGGTTTINLEKAKELFGGKVYEQEFASSAFAKVISETKYVGCIPSDNIIHQSYSSFQGFLRKLRFRVSENLNRGACAGFIYRENVSRKLTLRKYLFVAYAGSVILPIIDSVRLAVIYKDLTFLLHFIYTYYVVWVAVSEIIKKALNIKSKDIQYGK